MKENSNGLAEYLARCIIRPHLYQEETLRDMTKFFNRCINEFYSIPYQNEE